MHITKQGMLIATLALAAAGCATTGGQTLTSQAPSQTQPCSDLQERVAQVYHPSQITAARPVYRTRFLARAAQPRFVAGAELTLPAEHGVTHPYLQRVLGCYAASANELHPNDPLAHPNVHAVRVESRGSSFVIEVTGRDSASGRQIWERAKALTAPSGSVEIQQLSAAETAAATAL
jgi:hypothetical protein